MRYSKERKAETRQQVLEVAARQFRAKGPDKTSVGDIMSEAGLTHGGFYAHFASKDALVAASIDEMFNQSRGRTRRLDDALEGSDRQLSEALAEYWRSYLSPEHRDRPEHGCPLTSLSLDVSRNGGAATDAMTHGFTGMAGRVAYALERLGHDEPESTAKAIVSQMVGAITLARMLGPTAASDDVLQSCIADLDRRMGR